jgi:prophage regulatory protein
MPDAAGKNSNMSDVSRQDNACLVGLIRLPRVMELIPASASTIWLWVRLGKFPKPVRLGGRVTAWRLVDIQRVINGETNFTESE